MFQNYFKIAWRNLTHNKVWSFINIAGLSVGMAVAILTGLWIRDEVTFDRNNSHYKRIGVIKQTVNENGKVSVWDNMPWPIGAEIRKNYGGDFKYVVLSSWNQGRVFSYGDKKLTVTGAFFEPDGPRLLDLKMLRGTKDGLKDPNSILLSQSAARATFGEADPMDKVISVTGPLNVKVTGVYEDFPHNSSFEDMKYIMPFDLFLTSAGWNKMENPWRPNAFKAYVQLADHADFSTASAHIVDVKLRNVHKDELPYHAQLFIHPMQQWHLFSEFKEGINTGGRIQYIWMFGIIGAFVLLLACINFMNLSTAKSERRAREVGIRKAIGSLRGQLIRQFFGESLLVSLLAFVLSLLLVQLMLPFFNSVADKKMTLLVGSPMFWLCGLGCCLVTGLVAGSYPALYLSSFKPVQVLKGSFKVGRLAALPRRALVVLQFTVSVVLIIGTIVVFRQIRFAKDRPVGYDREGLVMLPMLSDDIHKHFDLVQSELRAKGTILQMGESGSPMTQYNSSNGGFEWEGKDPRLSVDFPNTEISYDYGATVGWQYAQGRGFSRDFATDSAAFVINEAAATFMGLKQAVGKTIRWDGRLMTVIGVVRDMVVESPYEPARPALFYLGRGALDQVMVKLAPGVTAGTALKDIHSQFKKYNPSQPFEYKFVDAEYARKFGDEERIGKLASCLAAIAIFISCLGLFALASFVAEQRTKEIGIRKVLGATVFNVWELLSKEFILLVVISLFIAIPVAWYCMYHWLRNYQYRAELGAWIFLAAAAGALLITILTVSWQAIRAGFANPVKSLRSE